MSQGTDSERGRLPGADSGAGTGPVVVPGPLAGFAEIPAHIAARVAAGERILLILLDAFGMVFVERHLDHPLLRRLVVRELSSQFPSTTTAHVTTLYTGLAVAEHGLYEWSVYEPSLGEIIQPLPFRRAGEELRDGLAASLDPADLLPGPTFYERLAVPSAVALPLGLVASVYSERACRGARLTGFEDLGVGVLSLIRSLAAGEAGFAYLYWPEIDSVSHRHGPESAEVHAAIRRALDGIEAALAAAPGGVTVLFCADHGQVAVDPGRLDLLDLEWPALAEHLTQTRPAGSARDVFLHVRPESVELVIDQLANRLEGRAGVHRAEALFPHVGPGLARRLAPVAVLPAPGRSAWLSELSTPALENLGSHGGRTQAEMATFLGELVS